MSFASLWVATANRGKLEEIKKLLEDMPVEVRSLNQMEKAPEIIEDGETFAENAVKKAEAVTRMTAEIALADDSGLEVDALEGAPGVYSARFAGEKAFDEENNEKLLEMLKGVEQEERTARFRCVIAVAVPGKETVTVEGCCEGKIAYEPRGTNGFGYDPLFYYPSFGCTLAQLKPEEKNRISHRGRALQEAKKVLENLL